MNVVIYGILQPKNVIRLVRPMVPAVRLPANVVLVIVKMDIVVTRPALDFARLVIYQQLIEEFVIVTILVMILQMNVMVQGPAEEPAMVLAAANIQVLQLLAVAYRIVII